MERKKKVQPRDGKKQEKKKSQRNEKEREREGTIFQYETFDSLIETSKNRLEIAPKVMLHKLESNIVEFFYFT